MNSTIIILINIIIILFSVLQIVLAVVKGLKRGIIKNLLRLIVKIISVVGGYFLAQLFANIIINGVVGEKLAQILVDIVGDKLQINNITVVLTILKAFVLPLIFIFVSFVIDKLLLFILVLLTQNLKAKNTASKIIGLIISLVTGLTGIFAFILPINGYIGLLNETKAYVMQTDLKDDARVTSIYNVTEDINNSFVFKSTSKMSKSTFDLMTKTKLVGLNGVKYTTFAGEELLGVIEVLPKVADVANNNNKEEILDNVVSVLDYRGEHSIKAIKILIADVVRQAGHNWKNGGEFLGFNLESQLDSANPLYFGATEPLLNGLSTCTEENVFDYLSSVANLVDALSNANDFADKLTEYSNHLVTSTATSTELGNVINSMQVMAEGIDNYNRKTFYEVIKIHANNFNLAEQNSISYAYLYGLIIEELYNCKDNADYQTQLQNTNSALLDIFYLINADSLDEQITSKINNALNGITQENSALFNAVNKTKLFNQMHEDKINFNLSQNKKGIMNLVIEQRKANSNQTQQEVLDNFNNLFIVG